MNEETKIHYEIEVYQVTIRTDSEKDYDRGRVSIYEQRVRDLDLDRLIRAVNGMEPKDGG